MLIDLQGKEFWKQALHMSFPPLFCMLRKTEQLSSSLLLEANLDGVELSPAVEMDSMYKKNPQTIQPECVK